VYFDKAPDGRSWPLVERAVFAPAVIDTLGACFSAAFEVGLEKEGLHNAVSFAHLIRKGRRDLTDAAIRAVLTGGGGDKLRWLLGDDLVFLVDNCSHRYHESGNAESRLGLHFDADFIGIRHLAVNLWVPLDPVGETAPGLTFLDPRVDTRTFIEEWRELIQRMPDPRRPLVRGRFDPDYVLRVAGEQVPEPMVTPVLAPGDALLFNQFIMHATQLMDGPHDLRRSFEFRVSSAGKIPTFYAFREMPLQHWSWRDGDWVAVD
jgi:hypothetical protein